jgi:hypothetical protein
MMAAVKFSRTSSYTANTVASPICLGFGRFGRFKGDLNKATGPLRFDISASVVRAANSEIKSSLEKDFRKYADKWYAETIRDSSISRMTSNVNYLKVIKLGTPVIPLILRELQSAPAPWFLALRVLTEEEVGKEYAGNFEKIAEAWVSWGKERGLI